MRGKVAGGSVAIASIAILIAGLSSLAQTSMRPPDALAVERRADVPILLLEVRSEADRSRVISDYSLREISAASRLGWTGVALPSGINAWDALKVMRRDPRLKDLAVVNPGPKGEAVRMISVGEPDSEDAHALLRLLKIGAPVGCHPLAATAMPLFPAWDGVLVAIESPSISCGPGARTALFITSDDGLLHPAALVPGTLRNWLPPNPPDRKASVKEARLVWGLLDGHPSGPLNPLWAISATKEPYLVDSAGEAIRSLSVGQSSSTESGN
jgi:hypothetical protein